VFITQRDMPCGMNMAWMACLHVEPKAQLPTGGGHTHLNDPVPLKATPEASPVSLSTAPETMTARNQGSVSRERPDIGSAPAPPTCERPYSVAQGGDHHGSCLQDTQRGIHADR